MFKKILSNSPKPSNIRNGLDCKKRLLPAWLAKGFVNENENKTEETVPKTEQLDSTKDSEMEPQFQIPSNPPLKFFGKIHYHTTVGDASEACVEIRSAFPSEHKVVGFDMEWTPTFRVGSEPCTAVLQLCPDHFSCHVFHLSVMPGFPQMLRLLIEDDDVMKVGVGIKDDMRKLGRDFLFPAKSIIEKSTVDLSQLANKVLKCKQNWSLKGLVQNQLNFGLSKRPTIRCGNWNQYPLTSEQLEYAALDAYASFLLYELLKSKEEG